ncbi:hypothetical protein Scep_024077 [Stephania cephalantha]|uniref:Uncharacterized protein n=1 Tax=Stephania cephalantha TaxID=152367 RepID=A0AAP0HWT6_9MAGN
MAIFSQFVTPPQPSMQLRSTSPYHLSTQLPTGQYSSPSPHGPSSPMTTSLYFVMPSPSSLAHTTLTPLSSTLNIDMHKATRERMGRHRDRVKIFLTIENEDYRDLESHEPPVNEDRIFYEALGKHNRKGRVYGFGSQASLSYYNTSGVESSWRPSYRAEDGQVLWEEYEELCAQLVRQMQGEMQEDRERQ